MPGAVREGAEGAEQEGEGLRKEASDDELSKKSDVTLDRMDAVGYACAPFGAVYGAE